MSKDIETIDNLEKDGQIDNLTIGILKVIKRVLRKELESMYHKRVIYESEKDDEKTIGELKEEKENE